MRTTLTIEDRLLADLKQHARATGKPFKQVIEEVLRAGLTAMEDPPPVPYRLEPRRLGEPRAGIDLTRSLDLAEALEDDELAAKLEQRR